MDATLSDPMVGRLLDGRYRIESRLASGGMASVYLATDARLERRVAVKVMHPHLADDPNTAARFEREARSAARLTHPDVVSVYDQGTDGGIAFLVMEYVPSINLRQLLQAEGRLSPGSALAVMDHVLAALGCAHDAGLVHRDVKPENVLVTADGRVKVADFGLAKPVIGNTLTKTGAELTGTAAYMAPETVEHGKVDARSDVYSAGIVLFELLTGAQPFTAEMPWAILQRHVKENVPAPSSRAPGIAPQLDVLVAAATARDPAARPATAGVFHADLVDVRDRLRLHAGVPGLPSAATNGLPAALPPTPPPNDITRVVGGPSVASRPPVGPARPAGQSNAARPRRRRRWWVLLAALLVTVALAVVAGWWLAIGRYTDTPKVLGLDRARAQAKLSAQGLHARWLAPVHSPTYSAGTVAVESPGPGHHVARHGTVSLRLSAGPVTHTLPDFAGATASSAQAQLSQLHYPIGPAKHGYSSTYDKGLVMGTDPKAGTVWPEGKPVQLVISKGAAPVTVPAVSQLSGDQATQLLSKQDGFAVTPVQRYNSSVPAGMAIRTSPSEGTKLTRGSAITLYISRGPHLYAVPNVDGEPLQAAISAVRNAGFQVKTSELFPFGPGDVVHHSPSSPQPRGTTITLYYY